MQLVNKHEAAKLTGMAANTLRDYRLMENSPLIKGVHYRVMNARVIRYNAYLIKHWADNRDRPEVHLNEVDRYLKAELQNQKSGTTKE